MRPEAALWLAAGLIALLGGLLMQIRRREARRLDWTLLPAGLTLAALAGGLAWRGLQMRAVPGGAPAEALLYMVAGALVLSLRPGARRQPVASVIVSGAGLVILAAVLVDTWWLMTPSLPQTRSWLFLLRNLVAGLGLGGWLNVLAAEALGLITRQPHPPAARATLLVAHPWLTLALLASGLWGLAAYGIMWRGVAGELWLAACWLIGVAYLSAELQPAGRALARWLLPGVATAGMATAIIAALQTASLFW